MRKPPVSFLFVLLFGFLAAHTASAQTSTAELRANINRGTVSIISGGVTGTYIRVASDLGNVLDDGDNLRVLTVAGKGSVQNINDILYLKGIDIGIVQSDVLEFVKRQRIHPTIEKRLRYITKLYNEEFHLLGGQGVNSVADLAGRKVNVGVKGSGTAMTASVVFELLGIDVELVNFDQALAVEKVKSGEIAGLVYVAGKPTRLFEDMQREGGLHFVPVEFTPALLKTYLPSRLTSEDYPGLVPAGKEVKTLAVGAVMAVYNWAPDTTRYEKVERFIDAFFSRFDQFQQPPRHSKWKEVSLSATVPGWERFEPARIWLAGGEEVVAEESATSTE